MSSFEPLTWEEFIYRLSALGFNYDPPSNSWLRADGAAAAEEALRDLHKYWPSFINAILKLYAEGKKQVSVECSWENGAFVARLRAME